MSERFNRVIVWFRRDIRVDDNTALTEACAASKQVIPIFVFDKAILERSDTGAARVVFLLDALKILDTNLQKLGGRLFIREGKNPDEILRALKEFDADAIFFNRDYEPLAVKRDAAVIEGAKEQGKVAVSFKDQVLFEPGEIKTGSGTNHTVFTPFKRIWFSLPADSPRKAPEHINVPNSIHSLKIPTVSDLKFSTSQQFECGGEDAANDLLDDFLHDRIRDYADQRNLPGIDGTSKLSKHLHFGTIGIRKLVNKSSGKVGADAWLNELAWREFYTQVLFDHPHVENGPLKENFADVQWSENEERFKAWCEGRTGYPIIDAAMRQLNTEAWMHNRCRMIVASFLSKDLLINWQEGERYFMKMLVDGDLAANNGGWQWTAGTGTDPQPYFRIFNPISQGEKFDPAGDYVRRYVPELKKVPTKVIHSPWLLSPAEQELIGCVIGKDYPAPIADHAKQRLAALEMYKKAAKPSGEGD